MDKPKTGKDVRKAKVMKDAAARDRGMRVASGAAQVAGIATTLLGGPAGAVLGPAIYASGVAAAEKGRSDNRKRAAQQTAAIDRGPKKPRSANPVLSDAYRTASTKTAGGRLSGSEAQRFKEASAEHAKRGVTNGDQTGQGDGQVEAHVRVNKKTGNAAPVRQHFRNPRGR